MLWFIFALLGPALYAVSNHIDKYLISSFHSSVTVSALIIVSSAIGFVFLPIPFFFGADPFALMVGDIFLLILAGMLGDIALFPYFKALEDDDPSVAMPIFQTIPVMQFVLGMIFLGEYLTRDQIYGAALIILASIAISFDVSEQRPRIKKKMLLNMLLSSLCFASASILFKFVVVDGEYWAVMFWEYFGALLFGLFLLFSKTRRDEFLEFARCSGGVGVVINGANELISLIAALVIRFAMVLAPVALVQSVSGAQPVFVFLYGILLTLCFPKIVKEDLRMRSIIHKLLSIAVIVVGAVMIV